MVPDLMGCFQLSGWPGQLDLVKNRLMGRQLSVCFKYAAGIQYFYTVLWMWMILLHGAESRVNDLTMVPGLKWPIDGCHLVISRNCTRIFC